MNKYKLSVKNFITGEFTVIEEIEFDTREEAEDIATAFIEDIGLEEDKIQIVSYR